MILERSNCEITGVLSYLLSPCRLDSRRRARSIDLTRGLEAAMGNLLISSWR